MYIYIYMYIHMYIYIYMHHIHVYVISLMFLILFISSIKIYPNTQFGLITDSDGIQKMLYQQGQHISINYVQQLINHCFVKQIHNLKI